MKTYLKKKLSLLLVLVLIVSLFAELPINAAAEGDTNYLAFSSDLHFDMAKTNPLDGWLTNLKNVVKSVDYMGFCGDMGSAYAATTTAVYWDHVKAGMDVANSYVTSGFITNNNIFIFGNHENYALGGGDYPNNNDTEAAKMLTPNGEVVKTEDYIIYACGSEHTGTDQYGGAQMFSTTAITALKTYLETAPKDIPIIIMSHFPLHSFAKKVSTNAADMISLLNNYPNVVFLWGHDHTDSDTYYDKILNPGDTLEIDAGKTPMVINFTYAAAGCMSDLEYGTGGNFVKGKGLLMAVSGTNVSMTYYGIDGKALAGAETVDITKTVNLTATATQQNTTAHTVALSDQAVTVNGVAKALEVYNIDGSNYFKLRDMAFVLNGTSSQFSVAYDAAKKAITCATATAYTADGSELIIGADKSASAVPSSQSLYIDGQDANLTAFNIGGNNFFKLRELGAALKFSVDYDDVSRTMIITSLGKTPVIPTPTGGTVYFYAIIDTEICKDKYGRQIVYYPIRFDAGATVADMITKLHRDAYGDANAWGHETNDMYGEVLNMLWGKACGNTIYGGGIWTDFSAGKHANLNARVTDGMIIYLNNFTGSFYMRTGYFNKQYAELNAGDSLSLTFHRCSGDGVVKLCPSQPVSIDGKAVGTTDSNGQVTLTFSKPGNYVITGAGKDSYCTAVCYVVVK